MEKYALVQFDTELVDNPDNITPAGYFVWLTRNSATMAQMSLSANEREASFTISDIGVYVARVVRMTASGNAFGSAAESEPLTVIADQVAVPVTVTLTIESAPTGIKVGN